MTRPRTRRERILDLIRDGEEDVDVLARALDVSASTIRRDLAVMRADGTVTRTYGGAVLAHAQPELGLAAREDENRAAKAAIARAAAALIADGDSVLLDAGSTAGALGRLLPGRPISVVTGNLRLVPLLADAPPLELTVLAGDVRPLSMGVIGPLTELTLRRITVDKVFLGCDGIVAARGLCEASAQQTALKELMAAQAAATYVLADASKLGRASQRFWAVLPRPFTLITDASADADEVAQFERHGIAVVRAPAQ
jgi:DeoR family transcriptional regulator, fructose operon transcriptional repressor